MLYLYSRRKLSTKIKNMDLKNILTDLGLGKTKGEVYLAALGTGTATAQDIAKAAGLPRTTAHEVLTQLCTAGVVSYTTKGRTQLYSAESPQKLLHLLKQKEKNLEAALPDLLALYKTTGPRPRMRFYNGVEGIKTVLEDTLAVKNKILRGILSMSDLYQIPGKKFMDDYVARRIAAGIHLEVIRSAQKEIEETWPSSHRELRELRYAAENLLFPMTMYLYNDKVAVIGTQRENFGMIIESAEMNLTLANLFGVLWEVSKVSKRVD